MLESVADVALTVAGGTGDKLATLGTAELGSAAATFKFQVLIRSSMLALLSSPK